MAKFVSLSFWVTLAVYLALASPLAVGWATTWLATNLPVLGVPLANLISSRIVAGVIWGILAVMIVLPGWRLLWKVPLGVGAWFSNRVFPDLNGSWTVTIQSNWPIVDKLKEAAQSADQTFDPFEDNELPELLEESFNVKIKQSWFRTNVEFLPNNESPLLESRTISVEFFKAENGAKSIAWIFEQENKQDNTRRLAVTDQPKFFGSAVLTVNDDISKIRGQYWQNRSWDRGLNAAGWIVFTRKDT